MNPLEDALTISSIAGLATGINMAANLTIERAKILICDRREAKKMPVKPAPPVNPGESVVPKINIPGGDKLQNLAQQGLEQAKDAALDAVEDATGLDLGGMFDSSNSYNKQFSVQFNPASMSITGYSGGVHEMLDYGGSDENKSARTAPLDTTLIFSVNLVFDQMELVNSFPMDAIDFSLSSVATKAIKAVTVAANPLSVSVQAATEGFIGVLNNPNTRLIGFKWGDLEYDGVLKNVRATYKMFDIYGRPVRSEVSLSIYLADKEVVASGGRADLGGWYKAYKKAFAGATSFASGLAQKGKQLSKIVNS